MSNKKTSYEENMLGETHLPSDLFTDTDALSWGLDTFPDLNKGLGVLNHDVLSDNVEPPSLPDGVVTGDYLTLAGDSDAEGQFIFGSVDDLGGMLHDAATLTDLSWLEFAEQDPERLPQNPVDLSIPELQEAWGKNRSTTGINLIPNVDLDAATYAKSLEEQSHKEVDRMALVDTVRQASRKVASGQPYRQVAEEAAAKLGHDAHLAREAMLRLKDDAGLIGRVFIRAADYPGCANGTWTDSVRKTASTARYVVEKKGCTNCVHAQNGSCAIFKKRLVAEVPWNEAAAKYGPVLASTGRDISPDLSPKEALRKSFAANPVGLKAIGDARPTHRAAADQIDTESARKALAAAPAVKLQTVNMTVAQATTALNRWKSAGMLSEADADRIITSGVSGHEMVRAGAKLIAVAREGSYSGGLNAGNMGYDASRKEVFASLQASQDRAQKAQAFVQAEHARRLQMASREGRRVAEIERKAGVLLKQVGKGLRGQALMDAFNRGFSKEDRALAASILDPQFKALNALQEPPSRKNAYSGLANDTRGVSVDAETAWRDLCAREIPAPLDLAERRRLQAHRKLVATLGRWVRDDLLTPAVASRLAASPAEPREVLRVAAALIGRVRVAEYSGLVNDVRIPELSNAEAWALLRTAEDTAKARTAQIEQEAAQRVHNASREGRRATMIADKANRIKAAVERGLRGDVLRSFIRKMVGRDEIAEVGVLVKPMLDKTGALENDTRKVRVYSDTRYEQAPQTQVKAVNPAHGEVSRLARWVRQQMAEGVSGQDLDHLLAGRFASNVRTAGASLLQTLRTAHEGLSGHVYVDAEAYATGTGVEGCERGALKHRANQIPAVMEMGRCSSCTHRAYKENGQPVCSLYNKQLIRSAGDIVENPAQYQAEMIRLANGTDADRTASLFANTYDTMEFRLGEDQEMDHLVLNDLPETEELGEVLFGGLVLE